MLFASTSRPCHNNGVRETEAKRMAKQQRTYWPDYIPLGNSDDSDRTLTDTNFSLLRRKGNAIGKHWGQGS